MLIVLIALYFGTSWILGAVYGPSYSSMAGEDSWIPDGNSGWVKHGEPSAPAPTEPSVNVPVVMYYLPILIPGFLLALFLFTPLRVMLDGEPAPKESQPEGSAEADSDDSEEVRPE